MSATIQSTRMPGIRGNPVHDEIKKAALTDFMAGDSTGKISIKYGISPQSTTNWSRQADLLQKLGFGMTPEEVKATRTSNYKGKPRGPKTEALSSTIRAGKARKNKNNDDRKTSNPSSSPARATVNYCPCCGADMFAVGIALAASQGR